MKPGAPEAPKHGSLISPPQPSASSIEPVGQENAPKNVVFDGDPTGSRSRDDGSAMKALPSVAIAKKVRVVNMVKNLREMESKGWRRN